MLTIRGLIKWRDLSDRKTNKTSQTSRIANSPARLVGARRTTQGNIGRTEWHWLEECWQDLMALARGMLAGLDGTG
ncbi:hypothetical protein RRG08_050592 [Elysia crispata]|uniref:Uncharacterized protein n=1 Tax=Elysia crispata TaxID=231223 RepID=A0AAE0Z8E4_9GAST|nr:hypothetical protein RRG08_050592 [Elysia crispata]